VRISWTAADGAQDYLVEWREASADAEFKGSASIVGTSFDHTLDSPPGRELQPNTAYEYRVSATTDVPSTATSEPSAVVIGAAAASLAAHLTISPDRGALPLEVLLDASASVADGGQAITSYEWDFEGDGVYDLDSGADPSVTHIYAEGGTLFPTVQITQTDSQQIEAFVSVIPGGWVHTWGTEIYEASSAINRSVAVTPGGGMYVSVLQEQNRSALLFRLTDDGTLLWARRWSEPNGLYQSVAVDVLSDGTVLQVVHDARQSDWKQFYRGPLMLRYGADGGLLSQRAWRTAGVEYGQTHNMVTDGDSIYVLNSWLDEGWFGSLLKFDADLQPVWQRRIEGLTPWMELALDEESNPVVAAPIDPYNPVGRFVTFSPQGEITSTLGLTFESTWDGNLGFRDIQYSDDGVVALVVENDGGDTNAVAVIDGSTVQWASGLLPSYRPRLRWTAGGDLLTLVEPQTLVRFDSTGSVVSALSLGMDAYHFELDVAGDLLLAGAATNTELDLQPDTYQTEPFGIAVSTETDVTAVPGSGEMVNLAGVAVEATGAWDTETDYSDALFMKLPQ
jgi:PKD repeat protein